MGNDVPAPVSGAIEMMRALHRAMCDGLVRACHDMSEGGLAVAAAEMAMAGRLGLVLDLTSLPRTSDVTSDVVALFAESNSRFLVEVAPDDAPALEETLAGYPVACLGRVTGDGVLRVRGLHEDVAIEEHIDDLLQAWQSPALM
jgi:phosphoribosylformylglycinamidine synthase